MSPFSGMCQARDDKASEVRVILIRLNSCPTPILNRDGKRDMVLKKKKPIKFFFMLQSVLLPDYRRSLKEEGRKVLSLNKK